MDISYAMKVSKNSARIVNHLKVWINLCVCWLVVNGADCHQADKLQLFTRLKDVRDNCNSFIWLTTMLVCHMHNTNVTHGCRTQDLVLI